MLIILELEIFLNDNHFYLMLAGNGFQRASIAALLSVIWGEFTSHVLY